MLLDSSGSYGVPIGINKSTKSIILNDSVWWTWRDFKTKFNQNNIERYQNLDFRGYEMLVNQNRFNVNYDKPCQQIAKVNINKLCKSSILSYFIGQFILLDYGCDSFIPIYVYTPTIVRTDQHIVMLSDLRQYVNHTPNALLHKDRIEIGNNFVSITTTSCAMAQDWKSYVVNELPNMNNIPD